QPLHGNSSATERVTFEVEDAALDWHVVDGQPKLCFVAGFKFLVRNPSRPETVGKRGDCGFTPLLGSASGFEILRFAIRDRESTPRIGAGFGERSRLSCFPEPAKRVNIGPRRRFAARIKDLPA